MYRVSKTEITLDDTRANNNDTSKVIVGEMTDDSDERQDVDAGDTDDTNDEDITTINQNNIDGSTLAFTANFTGNFVWVRAKITGLSAGSITKILYNN